MPETVTITYRYRVKDKHSAALNRMAKSVNYVWNYCNDAQKHAIKWGQKWPSRFTLTGATSGCSKELGLSSMTITEVCRIYESSRRTKKLPHLRYRGVKCLGWIPLRGGIYLKATSYGFRYFSTDYSVWMTRDIPAGGKIRDGSCFSQDSLGRWYLNVVLEIPADGDSASESVGIDLGLKDLATLSTGRKIEAKRIFRKTQPKLAKAQRAKKKRQVKKIHAKIANQRRDFLHKVSTDLTARFGHIVVGNVNAKALGRTKMSKSVHDASWSIFRNMLRYKAIGRGAVYQEVNEAYSSQTCSACGSIGGPKGREGLVIREWQCVHCGAFHDRDINAASNILRIGQDTRVAGAA